MCNYEFRILKQDLTFGSLKNMYAKLILDWSKTFGLSVIQLRLFKFSIIDKRTYFFPAFLEKQLLKLQFT